LITVKPSTSDRGDHFLLVDLRRQGKLDEDAVHARIGVELRHQRQQRLLRGSGGQAMLEARHPRLARRPAFRTHIDHARRILADEYHGKARRTPGGGFEGGHEAGDLRAQVRRERLAVDADRGHIAPCVISEAKIDGRMMLRRM
jgi:hypothetical protein